MCQIEYEKGSIKNRTNLQNSDIIGGSVFMEGLFSFMNPLDYETLLKEFLKLKNQSIMPFAKTAMGNFYLVGEVDNEKCIAFLQYTNRRI